MGLLGGATPPPAGNLLLNPGFEEGAAAWTSDHAVAGRLRRSRSEPQGIGRTQTGPGMIPGPVAVWKALL